MKPRIPFFCLTLCLVYFTSCKKENIEYPSGLQGKWELRSVSGGLSGGANYQPGNNHFLELTTSTYQFAAYGEIVSEGSYTLSKDINPQNGQTMDKLNFGKGHSVFYELSANNLMIYDGSISLDGSISKYEKIGQLPPAGGWCGTGSK